MDEKETKKKGYRPKSPQKRYGKNANAKLNPPRTKQVKKPGPAPRYRKNTQGKKGGERQPKKPIRIKIDL